MIMLSELDLLTDFVTEIVGLHCDSAWFIPKEWIHISRKLRDEVLGLSLYCKQLCTEKKYIYIYKKPLKFSEQKHLMQTTHEQSVSVLGISTLEKVCLASTSLLCVAAKVVWYLREYRSQRSLGFPSAHSPRVRSSLRIWQVTSRSILLLWSIRNTTALMRNPKKHNTYNCTCTTKKKKWGILNQYNKNAGQKELSLSRCGSWSHC